MSEIVAVRYTVEANNFIEIIFNDIPSANQPYGDGERYKYTDKLNTWLDVPNTIEPYSSDYGVSENTLKEAQNASMLNSGRALTNDDDARISTGATPIITDRSAHDAWMQQVYSNNDNGIVTIPKPPEGIRQLIQVDYEDTDPYTFTRFQSGWGWQWRMDLQRDSVNALAVAVYNSSGVYLYTTGGLLRNETDDGWYTICPPGQADPSPEDVYFKWLLGSATISGLETYKGNEETMSGTVRSDERYD